MSDDIRITRIRPSLRDAPAIPDEMAELFEFVWRRREEVARRAASHHDPLMQNFALRSLRHLAEVRQWLDGETIASDLTVKYLLRCALLHRRHSDFRAEWAMLET